MILCGCAAPKQPESTEAVAERKQRAQTQRADQREREEASLRLAVRQRYLTDYAPANAAIRKAILKEGLKVGMTTWDVIASYSLWAYTTDARIAPYRDTGVAALWTVVKRETTSSQTQQEEWILQRRKDVQHLYFTRGLLTGWKD